MKYKSGDSVFGLWPGSGGLYFKATIVAVDSKSQSYDAKFEEGTTYTLLEKHVKSVDSFKPGAVTTRSFRTTRRRSSTSRSRSRSRSRTPGRRTVKKDQESPKGKGTKQGAVEKKSEAPDASVETKPEVTEKKSTAPKAVVEKKPEVSEIVIETKSEIAEKVPEVTSTESELVAEVVDKPLEMIEDIPLSKRQRSPKVVEKSENAIRTRRSTRIACKTAAKLNSTSQHREESTIDGKVENKSKEEAEPMTSECDSTEVGPRCEPISKFQSIISAFNIFLLLSTTVSLHLICLYDKCSIYGLSLYSKDQIVAMYNPVASLVVLGYFTVVALMTLLPVGETVEELGKLRHSNAVLTTSVLTGSVLACVNYFQIPVSMFKTFLPQCILPAIVLGLVLASVISLQNKENGYNLLAGSTTNAHVGGVNIKIFLNRLVFQSVIILNLLAIRVDVHSPTLLISSLMQIILAAENLINEKSTLTNSYEFTTVKVGWQLIVTHLMYPFLTIVAALHIFQTGEEMPYYCLVPIMVLFLEGLWVKVASNQQKNAFLTNPEDASFSNMESLSSPLGEKLLISGWWGWLRHPNYLGEIIIHLSLILPCGINVVMPCILALLTSVFIGRTIGNDKASQMKYGPSWDRYCQRVPSRVLPHIY